MRNLAEVICVGPGSSFETQAFERFVRAKAQVSLFLFQFIFLYFVLFVPFLFQKKEEKDTTQ